MYMGIGKSRRPYALVIWKNFKAKSGREKPMTICGDGIIPDFTNVKDVVRANILVAES